MRCTFTHLCAALKSSDAYKVAVAVSLQESALHVQRGGETNAFGDLAKGIGVADGAVED